MLLAWGLCTNICIEPTVGTPLELLAGLQAELPFTNTKTKNYLCHNSLKIKDYVPLPKKAVKIWLGLGGSNFFFVLAENGFQTFQRAVQEY